MSRIEKKILVWTFALKINILHVITLNITRNKTNLKKPILESKRIRKKSNDSQDIKFKEINAVL